MGYGPEGSLQRTIDVINYNVTYFLGTALQNQACPLAAWNAYWTLRTHGIPTVRWVAGTLFQIIFQSAGLGVPDVTLHSACMFTELAGSRRVHEDSGLATIGALHVAGVGSHVLGAGLVSAAIGAVWSHGTCVRCRSESSMWSTAGWLTCQPCLWHGAGIGGW